MSTFEYRDEDGDRLEVWGKLDSHVAVIVTADGLCGEVHVAKEQAPALALAILESAGYGRGDGTWARRATICLKQHDHESATAKALAELDAEAEALFDAHYAGEYMWSRVTNENEKTRWRASARKAREIHNPKENNA